MKTRRSLMCLYCIAGKHRQCTNPVCTCICWEPLTAQEMAKGYTATHPQGRGQHGRGQEFKTPLAIALNKRRNELESLGLLDIPARAIVEFPQPLRAMAAAANRNAGSPIFKSQEKQS